MKLIFLCLSFIVGIVPFSNCHLYQGCYMNEALEPDPEPNRIPPLITTPTHEWVYPEVIPRFCPPHRIVRDLRVEPGDSVNLACPGSQFANSHLGGATYITATCSAEAPYRFEVGQEKYAFEQLLCQDWPEAVLNNTNIPCGPDNSNSYLIDVIFETTDSTEGDKVLFTSCFEEGNTRTWWSKNYIPRVIGSKINWRGGTSFKPDGLYDFNVALAYTADNQENNKFRFTDCGDKKIIHPPNEYFESGRLAPENDFFYPSWQRATFRYLDAQPQWTYFNRGSWQRLEENLRDAVEKRLHSQVEVYTGVTGQLCLSKYSGRRGPNCCYSFLGFNRLPVPECFWKMIIDEDTGCGIVIYGSNRPFSKEFFDSSGEFSSLSSSSSSSYEDDDDEGVQLLGPACTCPSGQQIDSHFLIDKAPGLSGCTVEGAKAGLREFPQDVSASCILRCF